MVLGKDLKLRAFHNICRHRAYTVVRKSCGNTARFSCKYHGWQYDDQGRLVKAPKFEEFPGFDLEENGLFEVKLISTREGLIFVNFDASTLNLPFDNVKSNVDFGSCVWIDGISVECSTNWKDIGRASYYVRRSANMVSHPVVGPSPPVGTSFQLVNSNEKTKEGEIAWSTNSCQRAERQVMVYIGAPTTI